MILDDAVLFGRTIRLVVDADARVVLCISAADGGGDGVRLVLGEGGEPTLDEMETTISIAMGEVSARKREIQFRTSPRYRSIVRAQARAARGGKEVA